MKQITGIKVGKTNITSTYVDNVSQSDSKEFTVTAVSLGSMSTIDDYFIYNGSEICPLPIITAIVNGESVELQNGRDYTLEYTNNVNASTDNKKAIITATGIGNFTGTLTQTFNINPMVVVLNWGPTSWRYDGNPHSTTCTVTNLVPGDTCTVTLSGNSITNIGSTTVTATGLDNPNYTLSGADNTSILLVINPGLFVKISGNWTPVKAVYKRVSGSWVQQDMTTAFSTSGRYIKSN